MKVKIPSLYEKIKSKRFIIAGPCVLESYEKSLMLAKWASKICEIYGFTYIFKGSFDKANRTSIDSFRGVGLEKGIEILSALNSEFYTTTDIHVPSQIERIAECVDIIQIPAFLSRQTDLLTLAGETGKIVNVKKFQLLSGIDMIRPIEKILSTSNDKILLTERGTIIPYGNVVVDLRNLVDMISFGYPVVMDCTHSCQSLNKGQVKTSGRREMAPIYAQAAAICGVQGFFTEVYKNPDEALSDASTSLNFEDFESLVKKVKRIQQDPDKIKTTYQKPKGIVATGMGANLAAINTYITDGTDTIKTGPKDKKSKVIIIGNSPTVLNKEYGKLIDSYDVVIRINTCITEGFEKYIGSKTDIWATSAFCLEENPNGLESEKPYFVPSNITELESIWYRTPSTFREFRKQIQAARKGSPWVKLATLLTENIIHYSMHKTKRFKDNFKEFTDRDGIVMKDSKSPFDTGLLAILTSTIFYADVTIHGFTFYSESDDEIICYYRGSDVGEDGKHPEDEAWSRAKNSKYDTHGRELKGTDATIPNYGAHFVDSKSTKERFKIINKLVEDKKIKILKV